jgi:isoleucyl-tRNA synthetase
VFAAGWVKLEDSWQQPELAKTWEQVRIIRQEANKVLEQARSTKDIGSSLEAKLLLYVPDAQLKQKLEAMNPADSLSGNRVDELRYLFLTSQVELLGSDDRLSGLKYQSQSDSLGIGVDDAEGRKCDRCWNYSTLVGKSALHSLLCERCVEAIDGKF